MSRMGKVVVGMSGGVDSFVTAMLLKQHGYEVIGVKLDLWGTDEAPELERLCRSLDVLLIHVDGREQFRREVVGPFVAGYLSGRTPNPCVVCNNHIKWRFLLEAADALGAERIATGHYVRILACGDHFYVHKGIDPNKDQSYFLGGLGQDVLSRALTPLGEYTKTEVKAMAEAGGFPEIAGKRESMGICFLEGGDYRDFIRGYSGSADALREGDIVDRQGTVIGKHSGVLNYTVGQKRGLPLVGERQQYVAGMDEIRNVIVACGKEELNVSLLRVCGVNAVCRDDLFAGDVEIRIRGLGLNPEGFVRVQDEGGGILSVSLSAPAWAVAPGQPVAFYRGDRVVGGGEIAPEKGTYEKYRGM